MHIFGSNIFGCQSSIFLSCTPQRGQTFNLVHINHNYSRFSELLRMLNKRSTSEYFLLQTKFLKRLAIKTWTRTNKNWTFSLKSQHTKHTQLIEIKFSWKKCFLNYLKKSMQCHRQTLSVMNSISSSQPQWILH